MSLNILPGPDAKLRGELAVYMERRWLRPWCPTRRFVGHWWWG